MHETVLIECRKECMKLIWKGSPGAIGSSPSGYMWCFDAPCIWQLNPPLGKQKEFTHKRPAGLAEDSLLALSVEKKSDLQV